MKVSKLFGRAAVPLFADLTCLYCIYLFFSAAADAGMMGFSFPLYVLTGLLATAVHCLLTRREPTLLAVVVSVVLLVAVSEALLIPTMTANSSLAAKVIAPFFFLYPALRSLALIRTPVDAAKMLTYSELSVLGTGLFLFMRMGVFAPPPLATAACLLALALNIFLLSALRLEGALQIQAQRGAALQRGLILLVAAVVLVVLALGLGVMLFPACRAFIQQLLVTLWQALVWLFRQIGRFLAWLFSLIPTQSGGEAPDFGQPIEYDFGEEGVAEQGLPLWLVLTILGAGAAALVGFLLLMLVRLRKLRLRWRLKLGNVTLEKSEAPKLRQLLRAALRRLRERLLLRWRLLRLRNHCLGVFFRLARRGRRRGLARAAAETPRAYLSRLSQNTREQDVEARAALMQLADDLERYCFRGEAVADPPRRQVKLMRQAVRHPPLRLAEFGKRLRAKWEEPL